MQQAIDVAYPTVALLYGGGPRGNSFSRVPASGFRWPINARDWVGRGFHNDRLVRMEQPNVLAVHRDFDWRPTLFTDLLASMAVSTKNT